MACIPQERADIIHSHIDYGSVFKQSGKPLIVTAHNYVLDKFMRPYSSLLQYIHYQTDLRWSTLYTLKQCHRVVAVSHYIANKLRDEATYKRKIDVIYNGVDLRRFTPRKHRKNTRTFRVFFCGNLSRRKRANLIYPLARALGQKFEIIYTSGLSSSAGLLEGKSGNTANLTCTGPVTYRDMPALYQTVDALFMPSVREGFGLCVAEAMAAGLPVVAANASAIPELIVDGHGGSLCEIDDLPAFTRTFKQLEESPDQCRRQGEFNRERAERLFGLTRMVRSYQALFEETLDNLSGKE
jgi:glycosyltransferase involved in cell wall biosynthesis